MFSGTPLAATPVPLNKIELIAELGVKDNQLSAALQFFLFELLLNATTRPEKIKDSQYITRIRLNRTR